ncbi:threonine synthase [Phreatobacter aquaticus]|uniref:Threonine synthase n=1 Tax=Phreatobacter aquaticus TaxID=2570229 RepID=A0A4D7QQN1_9HYPH|nr:threonine synthase [Phreatobacter aquaticus]QCK86422.1 threonine synthase [Phreatobacter aquaticus]
MLYISTRGEAPKLSFSDALLAGLARDGGLYVPESWPVLDEDTIAGFSGLAYADVAKQVLKPFVDGAIEEKAFHAMVDEAYASFRHPAVTPLVQLSSSEWVLELFHGPTLAFKDCAMQLLGRLMDHVLKARGQRATIVGATSGDTGGAAVEAFKGLEQVDVVILFPDGRVSDVQRRMMTTVNAPNVHALSIDGTFDDCQAIVKGLFNNLAFRDRVKLSGVNSINWARIVAQVVYYFVAGAALGAPGRAARYVVPTGNFGDIFAGYVAKRMGLPISELVVATNVNDILERTLRTGRYEVTGVVATSSPSMDIQVSSNFERLLFDAVGRDAATLRGMMASLSQSGSFSIGDAPMAAIRREFSAARADEAEVSACIRETLEKTGYLLDPHTAVGVVSARKGEADPKVPTVVLSTAHPAKFPDAVEAACGVRPALPAWTGDLMEREERMVHLAADQKAVETYVLEKTRAALLGAA